MRRNKIILLVIALVLVIGAELILFVRLKGAVAERMAPAAGRDGAEGESASWQLPSGNAQPGESAYYTAVPEQTQPPAAPPAAVTVTVTDVPAPTVEPAAATPAPSPEPPPDTPAPTAEPTPTAVPASTGSCSSNTGTGLNLNVDWSTEILGNGSTRVYVTGKAGSYSLDVMNTSATVTLGGQSAVCPVGSILIEKDDYTLSELFSVSFDIPSGSVETLTVDWSFNGSYSGVDLPHIIATGTVMG